MRDIVDALARWHAAGRRTALAMVVAVEGSAPRDPGAALAVSDTGEIAGSVSGGCVEADVVSEAQDALADGHARLRLYGIDDDDALAAGLTCGGTIEVAIAVVDAALLARFRAAVAADAPAALVIRLDPDATGRMLLVDDDGLCGTLGNPALDEGAAREAVAHLALGESVERRLGSAGEPAGDDVRVFIASFAPQPAMYVFGAVDFARAVARLGRFLGYRVTVVDARPAFATRARMPDADDIVVAWPHEWLAEAPVDERTVLVVLTHDTKFDIPLLRVATATPAGYIGAMGSRRTHAARLEALREAGLDEAAIARINGPIGLDIGARTPEETAVSIGAEIVALREGRRGGPLTGGSAPMHARRRTSSAC